MTNTSTEKSDTPATVIAKLREENCDPQLFGVYDGYRDIIVIKYNLDEGALTNFTIDELRTIRMPQYRHILIRYENIPITNIHFGTVVKKCASLTFEDLTADAVTPELCTKLYIDTETKTLPPILIYVPTWSKQFSENQDPIGSDIISALLVNSPIVGICESFTSINRFIIKTNFKKSLPQVSDTPAASPDPASGEQLCTLMRYEEHLRYFINWVVERCPAVPKQRTVEKAKEVHDLFKQLLKKRKSKLIALNTRKYDDYIYDELYKLLWTSRKRPQPLKLEAPNSAQRQIRRVVEIVTVVERAAGSTKLQQITEFNLKENKYDYAFRPGKVLDIGCADGYILEALGKVYGLETENLIGIDIRPARSTYITFNERSALDNTAFEPQTFDLITISMTLHHIARWKTVLKNAALWVKPDGYVFIREHDATTNADRLLLDVHDGAFNGSIWENPEQSWESFVTFAKSYFFGYTTLCLSAAATGLQLRSAQWDNVDMDNWKTHGMIYSVSFKRATGPLLPNISGTPQELEKYALMCVDMLFNILDPITHPDVLELGNFTIIAAENSFIAPQLPVLVSVVAPKLKHIPYCAESASSEKLFLLIIEAATAKDYDKLLKGDTSKLPKYVCIYRTREKNDAYKGASLAIEQAFMNIGYKLFTNGRVCYSDFAVICLINSSEEVRQKIKVMRY